MELQGLSNAASRSVLPVASSGVVSLNSGGCCNDPACNCVGGKAVAQQQLASDSTEVRLSEKAQQLATQTESEVAVQAVEASGKARAGFADLLGQSTASLSPNAQHAVRAYQQQAEFI